MGAAVCSANCELLNPRFKKSENKLTYYLCFQSVRSILQECQVLLAADKEHKKVYLEVLIIEFRNGTSLKNNIVRAILPKIANVGGSKTSRKNTCQVCYYVIKTNLFKTKARQKYIKFKMDLLIVTQKEFFTFWGVTFMMIIPMLEMLKQSSISSLITTKVKIGLLEKKNKNSPQKRFHSQCVQDY